MIIESSYYFNDSLRWNLGWPSPNYAGAFIATLLPALWLGTFANNSAGARRQIASCSLILFAIEVVAYVMLLKTYSRGALVAVATAGFLFVLMAWRCRLRISWTVWAIRSVLFVIGIVVTGMWQRIGPEYIETDGAVANRLNLWYNGLAMIAAAPIRGWGAGESGQAFMNWFQDIGRDESYNTMVNSYLHVAVEYGIWTLVLIVGALCQVLAPIIKRVTRMNDNREVIRADCDDNQEVTILVLAASSSLIAWAVVNIFSTLWISPFLWGVPVVAITVLVVLGSGKSEDRHGMFFKRGMELRRREARFGGEKAPTILWFKRLMRVVTAQLTMCVLFGVIVCGALYIVGHIALSKKQLRIQPGPMNTVVLSSSEKNTGKPKDGNQSSNFGSTTYGTVQSEQWYVFPDRKVLGDRPGHELRRWLLDLKSAEVMIVDTNGNVAARTKEVNANTVIMFGDQVGWLDGSIEITCGRLWIVHPRLPCPSWSRNGKSQKSGWRPSRDTMITVILPGVDEVGNGPGWRRWAAKNRAHVRQTPHTGNDIRASWPLDL